MRAQGVTISKLVSTLRVIFVAAFLTNSAHGEVFASEGMRIPQYQNVLKKVHGEANRFEELKVDPAKSGGSTLMGLISRLMGTSPNSQHEGVGVQRYIYTAFKDNKLVGVSHGSSVDVDGNMIHVLVHYDGEASVRGVEIIDAPAEVAAALKSQKFLDQFKGVANSDFQTTYEKRRRRTITHQAPVIKELRSPQPGVVRHYWDKIVRSLRYNVAFVDIAYFISRLPMMDFSSRRISSVAHSAGSPESMVQNAKLGSPDGDRSKTFIYNKQ